MVKKPTDPDETLRDEDSLGADRDFSKSLVDTVRAIILVLDTEGRIVNYNRFMEELTGYGLDEVKGKDWFTTFLPECDYDGMRDIFKGAIGGTQTRKNVNPIVTKDGREILIEWNDKMLKDEDDKVVGLVSIGQDITERRRAEEEAKKRVDEIEKLNKFMIGRELRIIDMKREINDLLVRLGEQPKYKV